jgi:hypothetical protein
VLDGSGGDAAIRVTQVQGHRGSAEPGPDRPGGYSRSRSG